MAVRFSNAFKIFFFTTLLLVICFVGVLAYVHKVLADEATINWTSLMAEVTSVTHSGYSYTANSTHKVTYTNNHNHTVSNRSIWGSVMFCEWVAGYGWLNIAQDAYWSYFTAAANTTSSYTTYRSETATLIQGENYMVEAASQLNSEDWNNGGEFVYVDTSTFSPLGTPTTPVSNSKP